MKEMFMFYHIYLSFPSMKKVWIFPKKIFVTMGGSCFFIKLNANTLSDSF